MFCVPMFTLPVPRIGLVPGSQMLLVQDTCATREKPESNVQLHKKRSQWLTAVNDLAVLEECCSRA